MRSCSRWCSCHCEGNVEDFFFFRCDPVLGGVVVVKVRLRYNVEEILIFLDEMLF